jgi:hypothetical protein
MMNTCYKPCGAYDESQGTFDSLDGDLHTFHPPVYAAFFCQRFTHVAFIFGAFLGTYRAFVFCMNIVQIKTRIHTVHCSLRVRMTRRMLLLKVTTVLCFGV